MNTRRVAKGFAATKYDIAIFDGDDELIAAGPNAVETWGTNTRRIVFVGYYNGEEDETPIDRHYRVATIMINSAGLADVELFDPGLMLDMVMFSTRTWKNVYGAGPSGAGFSADGGKTWSNKSGNLFTLLGTTVLKKIEPLIR
jgi:hypothetical protein